MKTLRLGKDITIKWKVKPLEGDLTLFIIDSRANRIKLDYWIEGENIVAKYLGKEQKYLGTYSVELWLNYKKENQSVIDRKYCFKLVCNSEEESDSVDLEDDYFSVGIQGESAYKAWLNIGNKGTEEDFVNYLTLSWDKLTEEQIEVLQTPAKTMADECRKDTDNCIDEMKQNMNECLSMVNNAVNNLDVILIQGNNKYNNF